MRAYQQAIGERPVAVSPGRRWPERISRMRPSRRDRAGRSVEVIQRRVRQAQLQDRAWNYVPDPRWSGGRR
jgi:hypothetical protein